MKDMTRAVTIVHIKKFMKRDIVIGLVAVSIIAIFVFAGCGEMETNNSVSSNSPPVTFTPTPSTTTSCTFGNVTVKYRDDRVNLCDSSFEDLDTSVSSFIGGAWYDSGNEYMVIKLQDTYYHYCGMPSSVWSGFKRADSFGAEYNASIKGNYDCREGYVPEY